MQTRAIIVLALALVIGLIPLTGCSKDKENKSQSNLSSAEINESSSKAAINSNFSSSMESMYFGNGLVAESGGYIYSIVGPGRFFKTKSGEANMQRYLTNEMQEGYTYAYLNVIGDWIYYLNKTTNTLCKVKTDRTGQKSIGGNVTKYIIYKGLIYFISSDDFSICKMELDGSQRRTIVDGSKNHITDMIIDNGLIYFNKGSEHYRFYVTIDGSDLQKTDLPTNSFISQNWAYYTEYDKNAKINILYRQNIKNQSKETLVGSGVSIYTKQSNYIYYIPTNSHESFEYSVYELNLDTKVSRQIMKTTVAGLSYINCTQNYIFISGSAFESHYTDTVRLPIAQATKAVEERFVLEDLKWENVKLDPKYR